MADDPDKHVRKQLLKKRDDASRRKVPLAPSEMVDDALARAMSGGARWLRSHFGVLQWLIVGAIGAGIGYGVYDHLAQKSAESSSTELLKAARAERGRITSASSSGKPDGDPDDPTPVFKTVDERRETALASYRKVASSHRGSGAAILARLGEAGVLLDRRDTGAALTAYREVQSSALAKADSSVRVSALEGIGLALETQGDQEGALKAFRELENTDVRGGRELGQYHQARILYAKGDADRAKELLKKARELLKPSGTSSSSASAGEPHTFGFLEAQIDDLLRRIDPAAVAAAPAAGPGGRGLDPAELGRLQQQLQRKLRDAKTAGNTAPAGSH